MNVLDIQDLTVAFGPVRVVEGVSLSVASGERVGVVGESGSGKTMTARAALGLLPPAARASGHVRFEGQDVLEMSPFCLYLTLSILSLIEVYKSAQASRILRGLAGFTF